jgi:predicted enzyme related to lactoylglutathione lyase
VNGSPIRVAPSTQEGTAGPALCIDANDPHRLARSWGGVLSWDAAAAHAGGVGLPFPPTREQEVGQNRMHFDLTSTSPADQQRTVARALELGGRHIDVGQRPDEGHVVLADPEGNEFCVIEPGNSFLAECGFVGALARDGTQEVGYSWSAALDWPLVWDQDEETAIRAPHGGPKITWGGPPVTPKTGRNRLHFDLAPPVVGNQMAEIERLLPLGASRVDTGGNGDGSVVMVDPDGNEFSVSSPGMA